MVWCLGGGPECKRTLKEVAALAAAVAPATTAALMCGRGGCGPAAAGTRATGATAAWCGGMGRVRWRGRSK